jgi:integrase
MKSGFIPSYCLHKASGQALVTLPDSATGKRHTKYLGVHGTPKSRAAYAAAISDWERAGRRVVNTDRVVPRVGEAVVRDVASAYMADRGSWYAPGEIRSIKTAMALLVEHLGDQPVGAVGPLKIKALREAMVELGWARNTVNSQCGRIVRVFRWGVENELVPASVYESIRSIEPLKRGQTTAPEPKPITSVDPEHVRAAKPYLSRQLQAVVDLQMLTGARPGEILRMTPGEIEKDAARGVWFYRPAQHKTAHRGKGKHVPLGPDAQNILAGFLDRPGDKPLFSPREAERERTGYDNPNAGDSYSGEGYRQAIHRACDRAGVPRWSPNQIRHTVATEVQRTHGLETSKALLGHSTATTTAAFYVDQNLDALAEIARARG